MWPFSKKQKMVEHPAVWTISTPELENLANDVKTKVLVSLVEEDFLDAEVAEAWDMNHFCVLKRPCDFGDAFVQKFKGMLPKDPELHTFFVMCISGLVACPEGEEEEGSKSPLKILKFEHQKEKEAEPPEDKK